MVHDFAKIKPEPVLAKQPVEAPPAWTLLFTGVVTGLAIGVFACFLFYLSGNVPPLQNTAQIREVGPATVAAAAVEEPVPQAAEDDELQLDFYEELQNYEVTVDVTPVDIQNSEPAALNDAGIMLQSGAYERRGSADNQLARLRALGLDTMVKQQVLPGRTLYLVQSGPFVSTDQLQNAESILRRNDINSIRISLH